MALVSERLKKIDGRLESVEERLESVEKELGKLRVLAEENDTQIKVIREQHGARFDGFDRQFGEIMKALAPLATIWDFIQRVASDHESRLVEVEKRAGVRQ